MSRTHCASLQGKTVNSEIVLGPAQIQLTYLQFWAQTAVRLCNGSGGKLILGASTSLPLGCCFVVLSLRACLQLTMYDIWYRIWVSHPQIVCTPRKSPAGLGRVFFYLIYFTTVPISIVQREKSLFFPSYDSYSRAFTEARGIISSPCFCRGSTVGIIRREKKRFFPLDNWCGHCSNIFAY